MLCDPVDCSMPGFPAHHQLLALTQTHVHRVGDAIQPSHPLSSPSPSAFNLAQHQGLFHLSVLHIRWPKYWSFSFRVSPFNEYSGLISFRMDRFDLLAVQGTLKSLLQHQMAVWGGFTNSCEKKRSKKQRRKGTIYPFECRVPKNRQER